MKATLFTRWRSFARISAAAAVFTAVFATQPALVQAADYLAVPQQRLPDGQDDIIEPTRYYRIIILITTRFPLSFASKDYKIEAYKSKDYKIINKIEAYKSLPAYTLLLDMRVLRAIVFIVLHVIK